MICIEGVWTEITCKHISNYYISSKSCYWYQSILWPRVFVPAGGSLPICAGCKQRIYDDQYLQALNTDWHTVCFRYDRHNVTTNDTPSQTCNEFTLTWITYLILFHESLLFVLCLSWSHYLDTVNRFLVWANKRSQFRWFLASMLLEHVNVKPLTSLCVITKLCDSPSPVNISTNG